MTFVTKLRFTSGDQAALEETVDEVKDTLHRKGAECKGPHTQSPERVRVPLSATLGPDDSFGEWRYDLYIRELEIHGSETVAREIAESGFHDAVHVAIEVDRKTPLGQGRGS